MRKVFLFFTIVFIVPTVMYAQGNNYGHMGGWGHMMNFGYGGMFMWLLFLIAVGVIIYLVFQSTKTKNLDVASREAPLDIAKRRYAKGEITQEEFERIKKDLNK
ncbi:MAG: SHOCT domain-containing protein [bacterium]